MRRKDEAGARLRGLDDALKELLAMIIKLLPNFVA
jgi:hypothetical protein